MSPLEIIGFIICGLSLAFLAGFGLMMGAWAGIKAGSWAFGAININWGPTRVIVETSTHD